MARANDSNQMYSIHADNEITVHASRASAPDGITFATEEALAKLAADWPSVRLVAIWNKLPAVRPVTKFTDRKTAVRRIWAAVRSSTAPPAAEPKSKRAKAPEGGTKSERVIALLRQPTGATLAQIMAATQWQSHSVRGFISGQLVKKQRLKVQSFKRDGERVYRIRS
jgi:uncharacterized protein DUF3489